MEKFEWQNGLKEKIDALCAIFPPVIKERWKNRLIYNTEKLAAYEGLTSVTDDVFWRSVSEVFPGGCLCGNQSLMEPRRDNQPTTLCGNVVLVEVKGCVGQGL